MALSVEHYVHDTPIAYANIHSFNRWFDETWGFDYEDRIYATALLSLRDLDRAVAELERRPARPGRQVVLLPTGPAYGRSPGDPYFDPIWARLDEAGVSVAFHIMAYWYNEHIAPAWGHDPIPASWHMSAWQWKNTLRRAADRGHALGADLRQPLRPLPEPQRAGRPSTAPSWVPHFVRHMDKSRGMGRNGPVDRRQAAASGRARSSGVTSGSRRTRRTTSSRSWSDLGHDDSIVMGSDYPHAEGLATPADFAKLLSPLPPDGPTQDHARQRGSVARRPVSGGGERGGVPRPCSRVPRRARVPGRRRRLGHRGVAADHPRSRAPRDRVAPGVWRRWPDPARAGRAGRGVRPRRGAHRRAARQLRDQDGRQHAAALGHRGAAAPLPAARSSPAPTAGARATRSPTPVPTSPRSRPGRCATATSG